MEGDRIAGLRSARGSLISVYVSRPSPGGFAALLSDLVKPLRDDTAGLDRGFQKSVRADSERIRGLAEDLELESAPGYAIFASNLDDTFVLEPLDHPTPNISTIGPRPYLRPLRASPRAMRAGAVVADHVRARTFVAMGGIVDEIADLEVELPTGSPGGFAGYDEHTVRGRADEMTSKLWRDAGETLLERHHQRPLDYLVVGSHFELIEEIARTLHPYLSRLPRVILTTSPTKLDITTLRAELIQADHGVRRDRQEALAGRVCDTVWSGGNAVLGLQDAIDAANTHAIDTLVVAGEFVRPGVVCESCGYLSRTGDQCPVCSAETFYVDDVVAALMDSVVASGGRVSQIEVASPLDTEGVGALTRFQVAV